MLISVVMPTYGHTEFIVTALRGVFAQQAPMELIIVDVKTDRPTRTLLRNLEEEGFFRGLNGRVQIVESGRRDHIHQINLGIRASCGGWVSVAASDDFYLPNKLSTELTLAKAKNALVVYSNFLYGDDQLNIMGASPVGDFSYRALIGRCMITDCSLVSRQVYDEFGPLNESLGSIAFFDRWLHVAEKYEARVVHNPFPGFIYRRHASQKSGKIEDPKRLGLMLKVARDSLRRKGLDAERLGEYRVTPLEYARP